MNKPATDSPLEWHCQVDQVGVSAPDLLHQTAGLSKGRIKDAMHKGALWLTRNGNTRRLRRHNAALQQGDELHLYINPQLLERTPEPPILIADEGGYSVWYKPFGVPCQGSKWSDHCTIQRQVEVTLKPQRPVFIVHRLDKAATGLLLLAHSKAMARQLSTLFSKRAIQKTYQVIVEGHFPISDSPTRIDTPLDGKASSSLVNCIATKTEPQRSLLSVQLITGRKHQIRRHLCGLGFPVIGDRLYGSEPDLAEDLKLTAVSLAFTHPEEQIDKHYELPKHLLPKF